MRCIQAGSKMSLHPAVERGYNKYDIVATLRTVLSCSRG
jgi:hypothetical protein